MSVRLWLPGSYPEWRVQRFYQGVHWSERSRRAAAAHEQVWAATLEALGTCIEPFPSPVVITVTEFCVRPADPSNRVQVVVVDGLIHAGLIVDDDYQHVAELRLRSRKVRDHDAEGVEIIIEEAEEAE